MTIRASDTSNSGLTATASTTVSAAAATHLTMTAPATTNTGGAVTVIVTARDPYENVVKSFADTIHFTSTDPAALLPADAALTNGSKSFIVKYYAPGPQSVTATDTANASLTATTTSTVNVVVSKLVVTIPANATAGVPFNARVTATDAYGKRVYGHGALHQHRCNGHFAVGHDPDKRHGELHGHPDQVRRSEDQWDGHGDQHDQGDKRLDYALRCCRRLVHGDCAGIDHGGSRFLCDRHGEGCLRQCGE